MKVSQRISEIQTQTVGLRLRWLQFTKGHNSLKSADGVMVLNPCTSSDDALYLVFVPSFKTISQRVSELMSGCDLFTELCKGL